VATFVALIDATARRARPAYVSSPPDGADRLLRRDRGVMGARASSPRCRPARACCASIAAAVQVSVSAMTRRVIFGCAGLLLIASSANAQQVVFSRRVYQVRGRSFQQLWTWSVADGKLTQLTISPRDHTSPICSADGRDVFSTTGAHGTLPARLERRGDRHPRRRHTRRDRTDSVCTTLSEWREVSAVASPIVMVA
jgi:hypothetical protein